MDTDDTAFQEGQELVLKYGEVDQIDLYVTFMRYLAGEKLAIVRIDSHYGDRTESAARIVNVSRLAAPA